MSYLLIYGFHLERIDVFELGGHKHACHSGYVELTQQLLLRSVFEVSVHKTYRQEKRLVVAFKVGKNLDHPVYHSCSQAVVYLLVVIQAI